MLLMPKDLGRKRHFAIQVTDHPRQPWEHVLRLALTLRLVQVLDQGVMGQIDLAEDRVLYRWLRGGAFRPT